MNDRPLLEALLKDAFIMKRKSIDKRFGYALYRGNMVIVGSVSYKQFKRFRDVFKERKERYTLNLQKVRGQHGKSLVKILYKLSKSQTDVNRCNPPEKGIQIQKGRYQCNAS